MTRRARYADTASAGRFPLRPGRPLIHRRRNGAWGWTCDCLTHARAGNACRVATHNRQDWADALRDALNHLRHAHKTRGQYETEALEALYALPAAERSTQ
ncbi:hypothetical protein [Streptomyces sp. t39]|uniref:hypothetical protein n=1 Tax=Streptomyces sp. t39 TaxID=1828156 RepID=UPI0011CEC75C|nr:hypothetical protein [Streptomyces sp. t39]TXS50148.1 hypothetical protein EAO77_27960 [Streptomyces sp. t39]